MVSVSGGCDRPRHFQLATATTIRTYGPFLARLLKVVRNSLSRQHLARPKQCFDIASGGEFGLPHGSLRFTRTSYAQPYRCTLDVSILVSSHFEQDHLSPIRL